MDTWPNMSDPGRPLVQAPPAWVLQTDIENAGPDAMPTPHGYE